MESWAQSRKRLLEEVGKAYDVIGVNLAAEIDEENTIRIPRTEWQTLKEHSERSSELAEENMYLIEELDRSKDTIARVEQLERDNQRLQRELEAALHDKQQVLSTPARARLFNKPTPSPTDYVPPSAQRVEQNGSSTISGDKYDILVKKHNQLYDQWKHHKSRREELEELCSSQREKVLRWEEHVEKLKKQSERKDVKIKLLKEQVEKFKVTSGVKMERPEDNSALQAPSSSIPGLIATKDNPRLGAISTMALNTDVRASEEPKDEANVAQNFGNVNNTSSKVAGGTNVGLDELAKGITELDEEPLILLPNVHNAMVIQDSEDEGDGEAELSLPKLPRLSENPELSENHHSSTTDEIPSPQTSKGKSQHVTIKVAPSSSPVMVSARCVRKRKAPHGARTPVTKFKVEELGSSSPARVHSSDSLDLDDIGEKVATPKKSRRLKELSREGPATSQGESRSRVHSQVRAVSEQISQETPVRRIGNSRTGPVLQSLSVNKQIISRDSDKRDPKRRRIADDIAIGALTEDGTIITAVEEPKQKDLEHMGRLTELLDKPSPAKRVLSSPKRVNNSSKRERNPLAKPAIAVYDEESQNEELVMPTARRAANPFRQHQATSASSSRSSHRSEERSRSSSRGSAEPQRPGFVGFPVISGTISKLISREIPEHPITPKYIFSKSYKTSMTPKVTSAQATNKMSTSTARKRQTRTMPTEDEWENDPEQEPLRLRPVESLRLEDFRINPNYNGGYNYAFSEVVRGKNERTALHACTKLGCCGDKFRALAMAGRNFDVERTPSELEADNKLIREFLGDNAHTLGRMSKSEKDAVWIQARARQLGNENGRHRHAYERAPTPPGFWRADFPTTQEIAEERVKGEAQVRIQVRQRYEEAMREKGAFIFRDE